MKSQRRFSRCLTAGLCLFVFTSAPAYALSGQAHTSQSRDYIGGMSTETIRNIHTEIIDTVPWYKGGHAGGKGHREAWGHTDEWYYGKMKDAVPPEHLGSVKNLPNITGREYIALKIRSAYPHLTKKEALAIADQAHDSHLLGDSTTPEGKNIPRQEIAERLKNPSSEALSAMNKCAMAESEKSSSNNPPGKAILGQRGNSERFIVQGMAQKNGDVIYNPPRRNRIGVTRDGQDYVVVEKRTQITKELDKLSSNEKILVPADEYEKYRASCEKKGVTLDSRVVPDKATSQDWDNMKKSAYNSNKAAITFAKAKIALRNAAPGIIAGGLQALGENWKDVTAAWNGEKAWDDVLVKVGKDFAGYTLTPMIVNGVIVRLPDKLVLLAPLKHSGTATIIGVFVFGASKDFYAYYRGDQNWEDTVAQLKKRTAATAQQTAVFAATIVFNKVVSTALSYCLVPAPWIPVVIVAGPIVWQIGKDYLEKERRRQTIYVEDLIGLLGEGFVREFHLLCPEPRDNILEPEERDNILEPECRANILMPELRDNILQPVR